MSSFHATPQVHDPSDTDHRLTRLALRCVTWAERWIPDAFVFALIGTLVVLGAALLWTSSSLGSVLDAWGQGFWELIPFTLQMALIIITGHVLASSAPIRFVIHRVAAWPSDPRSAVAMVTAFALVTSWFNWGFSLIFSAVLARQVARNIAEVDYRALAAASFLGLGSIWAQGLSGSAALQMASPGALQPAIRDIVAAGSAVPDGIIPLRHTIFLWQSLVAVVVEIVIVTAVMWLATPSAGRGKTARQLGIDLDVDDSTTAPRPDHLPPGQWLEHSPWLNAAVVALGMAYIIRVFTAAPDPLSALTLNLLNFMFLMAGIALHVTPARLMQAVREATPAVWGIILQFPFYAGMAAVITSTHLNEQLAQLFVGISNRTTYPALVALYSAVLGVFVPSGGTKWVIEAPYVMAAAHNLKVHLGWVVVAYDLGEALANLVQPFWMLPILGMFRLAARDVMGFTLLVFLVLFPLVLLLVTVLGLALSYPL
jgi:short-chain fatty acids transporter